MTKPIDRDQAHQVAADLLRELEGQADPFLDEVLQRHGVRGLRVVGPLVLPQAWHGRRSSLTELLGSIGAAQIGEPTSSWTWALTSAAYPPDQVPDRIAQGEEPTRNAADRALCLALRELGWAPVEVPPEPLEHGVELPPGFVEQDEAATSGRPRPREVLRTDEDLRLDVQRAPGAAALDPYELATATGADLDRLAGQVGVRRQWQQEFQQRPVPARTMEDVVPGINAQLRADRAEIRRRGQGVDYGLVLDPAAAPTARITDDGMGLEFSNLTPAQAEVIQRQMEPISTRTRDPALYALLQVVRLPDGASLWSYLDAADRRLLVMEPIVVDPIP